MQKVQIVSFNLLVAVMVIGLWGAGCSGESGKSCESIADCGACEFCNQGTCLQEPDCTVCDIDAECGPGEHCNQALQRCEDTVITDGDTDVVDSDEDIEDLPSTCTDAEKQCQGTIVYVCSGGQWQLQENCSDNGKVCQSGACVDDVLPDGDDVEVDGDVVEYEIDTFEVPELGDVELPPAQCDVTGTGKQITIDPSSEAIDFGAVQVGLYRVDYITICNSGTESFAVTNVKMRHGDTAEFQLQSEATPMTLPSGEGTVVAVIYQPRDYVDDEGMVEILSDSNRQQVDISLNGRTKPLGQLQVRPQVLQFQNQGGTKIVALDNVGVADASILSIQVSDGSHFSVTAIEPGGLTGPWSMHPNDFMNVSVTFDGVATAQDTELIIIWFNGESQIETTVSLQVGGAGVCAIPDAGPDQTVAPLATVQLDGSLSVDPNDVPEPGELWYQWNFSQKPQGAFRATIVDASGASIQGVWTTEARPTFYAELAGLYVVQLRINQQDDAGCNVVDTVNIMAVPDETMHIQLRWSTAGNDHDLHLIRHSVEGQTDAPGCFTHSDASNTNDCHWTNCNTQNETAFPCPARGCPGPNDAPDWGAIGDRADDPTLDIDDIPSTGPENINLSLPATGDYFVAVERYSGSSAPELTVKIWLFGVLQATFSNVMIPTVHNHWNVCWLKVHSAADIEIVPIGIIKDSGDGSARDCTPATP